MITYEEYVQGFARAMLLKLYRNSHKGEWRVTDLSMMLDLLRDEVKELHAEISCGQFLDTDKIVYECADVANFAMMIASIALRLQDRDINQFLKPRTWTTTDGTDRCTMEKF